MSILDADGPTMTGAGGVTEVWRRKRGRALALLVGCGAAVAGGSASLVAGTSHASGAAVAAGVLVAGAACLAEHAPNFRRPIVAPFPPQSPEARLEALVFERTGENADEIADVRAEAQGEVRALNQRVDELADLLSAASGYVSSSAERLRSRQYS